MVKSFKSYVNNVPVKVTGESLVWGEPSITNKNYLERPLIELRCIDYTLPEPPKNISKKTLTELEILERISTSKIPEDGELIKKYDVKVFEYFIDILNENKLEYDIKEIKHLMDDIESIVMVEKFKFNRPRPTQLAEKLGYELDDVYYKESTTANSPTYPSRHSTQSRFLTSYLSEKYPSLRNTFLKLSEEISLSRIRGLLHYPTDVLAGELLGQFLYEQYSKNTET
ncbi:MAG: phosphatase PAP2 family protein [Proteobacteria bacterium]|nr:phosphatase PAP2 family protein [Pseudomonadota bacterium]